MKYTNEDLTYLKEFYSFEQKDVILSHLSGHSWKSISDYARRAGLSRPRTIRRPKLDVLLDHTLENCYWWGLIYADGYLPENGKLVVQLWDTDLDYLQRLADKLNINLSAVPKSMIRLEVMDKSSSGKLRSTLGMKTKKTYNPPENFDFLRTPEQRLAFFIGFSDGDGCVTFDHNLSFKSLRIVVHENWFEIFRKLCILLEEDFGLHFTVTKNGRRNTSVYLGSKESHRTIIKFIEANQLPVLERKWYNKSKGYNINEHHNDRKADAQDHQENR